MSYLYLLQTRESIKLNEPIYKIGRTKREGLKRFEQYPAGSNLILHVECANSKEKEKIIKELFKEHFKQITEYGSEYFMGDVNLMKLHMSLVANVYDISSGYSGISKLFGFIGQHVIDVTKKFPSPHMVLDGPDDSSDDGPDEVEIHQPKSKIAEILNGVPTEPDAGLVDELVESDANRIDVKCNNEQQNNINQIEILDNNEFIYKCEICKMGYKTKNGFAKHIRQNHKNDSNPKKYNCKYCYKKYNSRQSKWVHEQKCKTNNEITIEEKLDILNKKITGLQKVEPKVVQKNKIICL